jgi:hypothetical protein
MAVLVKLAKDKEKRKLQTHFLIIATLDALIIMF